MTVAFAWALLSGTLAALAAPVVEPLRTVEELPVDRFDEYQAGALPPHPWQCTGDLAPGVTLALQPDGESLFVANKVTGKGLVLDDRSTTAGSGVGIACEFTSPPLGNLYLCFDFSYTRPDAGAGLDLTCELSGPAGCPPFTVRLGGRDTLSFDGANDEPESLSPLTPGTWYHLAIEIDPAGTAAFSLAETKDPKHPRKLGNHALSARNKEPDRLKPGHQPVGVHASACPASTPVESPPVQPAPAYTRLCFRSSGLDAATGSWRVDNICMAGQVDAPRQAWWPFDQAPLAKLQRSPRKVFAYYFIFTSGHSTEDPGLSWYTRTVLNPSGNTKKDRAKAGTELLYRPFPRPPLPASLDKQEAIVQAMAEEVRLARQAGCDGFLVDFWAEPHPTNGQAHFSNNSFALLDAAQRVDPGFKILPAVYSKAEKSGINGEGDEGCDPVVYANSPIIKRIAEHPAALRMPDGRIVFSMWLTERHSVAWWRKAMDQMEKNGHPIALLAHFNSLGKLSDFAPISYGMANWGPRSPGPYDWVSRVRGLTTKVVFPIVEQDVRTRGCELWESGGSATLTGLWNTAIADKADWTFLISWSDFSEQAMQPSTCIGFAPYDLNAYYTQWFKTGRQPAIVRDTLYYFYRKNHTDIDPGKGVKWSFRRDGATPANEIELLAFLAAPGTLRITVAGTVHELAAPRGITSFKVPLPKDAAFVPEFALLRDGKPVVARNGHFAVLDKVEYPNLLYCSGVIAPERTGHAGGTSWWRRLWPWTGLCLERQNRNHRESF